MLIGIGAIFVALALFQLYSGRAFIEVTNYINPNSLPTTVTRRKQPKHFWFFVVFNFAVGLFFIAGALIG